MISLKIKRLIASALSLSFVLLLLFVPLFERLCISDKNSIILLLDCKGFEISFTHSVNRGRVVDIYSIEGSTLVLRATRFSSYGAGMPDPTGSQTFVQKDDYYELGGIDMPLESLTMQTGVIADHHLAANGQEHIFNELVPSQTRLTLRAEQKSAAQLLAYYISLL